MERSLALLRGVGHILERHPALLQLSTSLHVVLVFLLLTLLASRNIEGSDHCCGSETINFGSGFDLPVNYGSGSDFQIISDPDSDPDLTFYIFSDPDPGFGSGILDFRFKDPDPKLLISDPEH